MIINSQEGVQDAPNCNHSRYRYRHGSCRGSASDCGGLQRPRTGMSRSLLNLELGRYSSVTILRLTTGSKSDGRRRGPSTMFPVRPGMAAIGGIGGEAARPRTVLHDPYRPLCRGSTLVLPFGRQQLSRRGAPQKLSAVASRSLNGSFPFASVFVLFSRRANRVTERSSAPEASKPSV